MVDRLLVDIDAGGCVSVTPWFEGELPEQAGEPAALAWQLTGENLDDLRWYLEDYLRAPFGVYEDRGSGIAARLPDWGRSVFTALFGAGPARDAYVRLRTRAVRAGAAEIVLRSASPAWLGLPWELMRDPALPDPVVLDGVGISRSLPGRPGGGFAVSGERLRVLMVISRPRGTDDVGYQMIARPLLARLAAVRGTVELEVLRPPTLDALEATLQAAAEAGTPYQIVHFDGHGVLTGARAGSHDGADGPPWHFADPAGQGVLVFEKPTGGPDQVPAERVARVLADARVPVVVLNACQSGAVGKQLEAAVATRLLAAGMSAVVAMAYSVYAVAAAEFMTAFYERLFAGDPVADAVRAGRARMARRPKRPSPKGDLDLADWLVPVHYWRREVHFPQLRPAPPAATRPSVSLDAALDRLREATAVDGADPLAPVGEFVGRDALFYTIEAAARTSRVIVLHGPGGTGKTELAKAFGRWWRDTGGVERPDLVVWHSFEPGRETAGLSGVISALGLRVFGPDFARETPDVQRQLIDSLLREHRLLLIWDNVESIASMPDPTIATPPLDAAGQDELRAFLAGVAQRGRSTVLLTSRTPESWLGEEIRRVEVGGLTQDEAVDYADQLLAPFPAAGPRRSHRAFADLLKWLDGHPLSMRLVLPHLDTAGPAALLEALRGTRPLPGNTDGGRTTSLPGCITYSINHLDPAARRLLTATALFHGVADANVLSLFAECEHTPAHFRGVSPDRWVDVLDQAARLGLLIALGAVMYRIHPALPSYLVEQWRAEAAADYEPQRAAAELALLEAQALLATWLTRQIAAGDAALAFQVIELHRPTMNHLLGYALDGGHWDEALQLAAPLNYYWERTGLTAEARGWVDRSRAALEGPNGTPPALDGPAGALWLFLVGAEANRQQDAGRYDAAQATYQAILDMLIVQPETDRRNGYLATVYHQLGRLAHDRGQWDQAEQWYHKSLTINKKLRNRPGMAMSYGQLGLLADDRGNAGQALGWTVRCVALFDDFPHPAMGPGPHHLARLSRRLGVDELERCWQRATGRPLPAVVRTFVETYDLGESEESE